MHFVNFISDFSTIIFIFQYDAGRHDLHVKEAWAQGYTGKGIVVSILDDGIEKNHPDLQGNYVSVYCKW